MRSNGVGTLGAVDIDGGAIDGTVIGANAAAAGTFTTVTGTLQTAAQPNITSVGTFTAVDIDGGAIDGAMNKFKFCTELQVDNINVNGNTISSSVKH